MKKFISLILCISLCAGIFAMPAFAAQGIIEDGLSDLTKLESSTGNVGVETKTLGSYENAQYAFSTAAEYEVVYKLDNVASFEVEMLHFNKQEGVAFFASDTKDGEYTELKDFEVSEQAINNNWALKKYSGTIDVENASYFKISVNQSKPKYIRLDSVKLASQFKLEVTQTKLFSGERELTGDNVFGADKLVIGFNQPVSVIPSLTVTASDFASFTAAGKIGSDGSTVIYEFESLGFDVYSFTADGFETLTKQSCDFEKNAGCKVIYAMPEYIHFGEDYSLTDYIAGFENSKGDEISVAGLEISSGNSDIIAVGDSGFELKKAGVCEINAAFELDGVNVSLKRNVTLCDVKKMLVTPSSVSLRNGESCEFKVELMLTDDTLCPPQSISAVSSDYTIATVSQNTITAADDGNTFINVTADYYGQSYRAVIAVGVGGKPLPAAKSARLSLNRSNPAVGESVYAVVSCELENGAAADSLSMQKTFFTDNDAVVEIDSDGRLTAKAVGSAKVWAEVSMGGVTVVTEKVTVTVQADDIVDARLILPAYYMRSGSSMKPSVRAVTRTGRLIDDYDAVYSASGTAVSVSGDTLNAVSAGSAVISATVTYEGKSIQTDSVTVDVVRDNGETAKLFLTDTTWDGVFEHTSDLTIYDNTGVMPGPVDAVNQYVIFESKQEISGLRAKFHYLNSRHEDDLQLWVSPDNSEGSYVRIPESKMTVSERVESGAWYFLWFDYSGELLSGARYVKVVIDVHDGANAQGKRLHEMHMEHNNAPEVAGISLLNKNGGKASGTDAVSCAITFSRDVDSATLGDIKLVSKEDGAWVAFDGVYNDGIYTINFGKLEQREYTLSVSGVKNSFGTEMTPAEFEIIPTSGNRINVKNAELAAGVASAVITNNTSDSINATVICAVYDENGYMKDMLAEPITLAPGENSYSSGETLGDGAAVRVYVWTELNELSVY